MRYPSIFIFIAISVGILVEYYLPMDFFVWLILLAASLLLSGYFHQKFNLENSKYYLYSKLVLFISIGGLLLLAHSQKYHQQNQFLRPQANLWIHGKAIKKEKSSEFYQKWRFQLDAFRKNDSILQAKTVVLLRLPLGFDDSINFENNYFLHGKLTSIADAQYPHAFDYSLYMKRRGIYYQFTVDSVIVSSKTTHSFLRQTHLNFLHKIDESILNHNAKEILKALTLGDRTEMSSESLQTYSLSGIIHLFAISGLHIGLLYALIFSLLKPFFSIKNRKYLIVTSLILISFYAAFIQFPVSVCRALIMIWLYSGFIILKRPVLPFHVLALAAIIILIIDPFQLFEVGFQLSFIAVFFILYYYPSLKNIWKARGWRRRIRDVVTVSFSAQLGTLPLSLFYFHQYSLLSFLLNLILIPFAAIIVLFSFFTFLSIVFFPDFLLPIKTYNAMVSLVFSLAKYSTSFDSLVNTKIPFSFVELLFAYLGLWYFGKYLKNLAPKLLYYSLIVVFVGVLAGNFVYYLRLKTDEIVVYPVYKNTILSYKSGNQLRYWAYDPIDVHFKNYAMKPYEIYFRNPGIYTEIGAIKKLEIQKTSIHFVSSAQIPIIKPNDVIILTKSPKVNWDSLVLLPAKMIIVDRNNYPDYAERFKQYCIENKKANKCWLSSEKGSYVFTPSIPKK